MRISSVCPKDSKHQPQLALALVSSLESGSAASVFATARLRRQLSREQAAQRSGITAEQVAWLEEGRAYAFRTPEDALAAAVLLATGLEIDNYEARELAGLPVLPRPIGRHPRGRLALVGALALIAVSGAIMLGYALHDPAGRVLPIQSEATTLPAPWQVDVVVENGGGDINYTRRVASRIAGLGYQVTSIKRASSFRYKHSTVFYSSVKNGREIGERLANELEVELLPLPQGKDPRRLVVIVGPPNLALR